MLKNKKFLEEQASYCVDRLINKLGAVIFGALNPFLFKRIATSLYHIFFVHNKNLLLFALSVIIALICILATSTTSTIPRFKFGRKGIEPSIIFLIIRFEAPISLLSDFPITNVGFIVQTSIFLLSPIRLVNYQTLTLKQKKQ